MCGGDEWGILHRYKVTVPVRRGASGVAMGKSMGTLNLTVQRVAHLIQRCCLRARGKGGEVEMTPPPSPPQTCPGLVRVADGLGRVQWVYRSSSSGAVPLGSPDRWHHPLASRDGKVTCPRNVSRRSGAARRVAVVQCVHRDLHPSASVRTSVSPSCPFNHEFCIHHDCQPYISVVAAFASAYLQL